MRGSERARIPLSHECAHRPPPPCPRPRRGEPQPQRQSQFPGRARRAVVAPFAAARRCRHGGDDGAGQLERGRLRRRRRRVGRRGAVAARGLQRGRQEHGRRAERAGRLHRDGALCRGRPAGCGHPRLCQQRQRQRLRHARRRPPRRHVLLRPVGHRRARRRGHHARPAGDEPRGADRPLPACQRLEPTPASGRGIRQGNGRPRHLRRRGGAQRRQLGLQEGLGLQPSHHAADADRDRPPAPARAAPSTTAAAAARPGAATSAARRTGTATSRAAPPTTRRAATTRA